MKNLLRIGTIVSFFVFAIPLSAQVGNHAKTRSIYAAEKNMIASEPSGSGNFEKEMYSGFPEAAPLLISIPGATPIGIFGKYHNQSSHGGLHNIQVDPDDPMKIHAVIMTALNVTASDTTTTNNFPQRNIFYTYSSDGGVTWKAPKKVSPFRAGFPQMILYKRNGVNVPVIGAHRYIDATTQQFISTLFVEKGAPGDGNFAEAPADMNSFEGDSKQILWPSISASSDNTKIFMIAAAQITTQSTLEHIQFATFTLAADGTPTFGSWQAGPASDVDLGLSTSGSYVINTAKSGKIGILWQAWDFNTPDRGIYLSESTDGGKTWSSAVNVYAPASTQQSGAPYFDPSGEDFFYSSDEKANVIISANYEAGTFTNNVFDPNSGGILFWKTGMSKPVYIIGKQSDNDFNASVLDGSWLSDWNGTQGIDPQGANLEYPTIAHGTDTKWSIFFEAWAQDDTGTYLLPPPYTSSDGSDTSIKYPFHGIYRIDTKDGGQTFEGPIPIRVNTITDPQEKKRDYRFAETSTFTPGNANGFLFPLMYGADSLAGLSVFAQSPTAYAGMPNFDDLQWFYEQNARSGVHNSGNTTAFGMNQNFPNPFIGSTTIPVVMKDDEMATLTVSDMLGREIATIFSGRLSAGERRIQFSAGNLGAGIYTYTLKTPSGNISRTMTVVK